MKSLKVLIVDDAKFICELVTKIVSDAFPEATVKAAFNGEEAQVLLTSGAFDIILCDWEMPKMSGLEVLKWTRAQPRYKTVPFVMVTSRGEREYVLKAIHAGVNDYLGKPFSKEQLIQKINKVLHKQKAPDVIQQAKAAKMLAEEQQENVPPSRSVLKPKGMAYLRVGDQVYKCAIKDMSLKDVLVVVKNEGEFPQVLDQAVIDIEQLSGDSVARVNGFIQMVEAADVHINSAFINIRITLVDDDPDKMAHLSKYIASVR
ncbi:response regulator [Neptunomonas qingdaonensis]|uniref:Response regulator receiver domain-containing protein n=1 Tax=Neptunomonas qingdaonensis TaxID=1045558 RepID=A0A1I2VLZ4_9GAMM|nr:response regulator [Neptunomonas qingdaonensis]SFG89439.1 Response regulator receiver domain-containing protein [Neptunomonas qingdaonensis]